MLPEAFPSVSCADCGTEGKVLESGRCWDCNEKAILAEEKRKWQEKRTAENLKLLEKQVGKDDWSEFEFEGCATTAANRSILAFFRAFNPLSENCYVWGANGSGKSRLGVAAIKAAVRSGNYLAEFWRPMELHRHFNALNLKPELYKSELERLGSLDILMIDEFARGKDTEKSLEVVFELVDYRKRNGKNGNIFTSNFSPSDAAAKLGDRSIVDRIMEICPDGYIFELTEPVSWRVKNRGRA